MESTNISGIGKIVTQGQPVGVSKDVKEEDEKISFLDLMNQMAVKFPESAGEISAKPQTPDEPVRYSYRENGVKRQDMKKLSAADQRVTEKWSAYEKDVKEVLKEELGVTEEELEEAMEALGLTVADLMNPNLLAELAVKLTGCQNVSELLCNDDFMIVMQTVNELTENLLTELGVSMEELVQSLEEAMNVVEETVSDNLEIMSDEQPQDVKNPELHVPREETAQEGIEQPQGEEAKTDIAVEEDLKEEHFLNKGQEEPLEESALTEENVKPAQTSENTSWKGGQSQNNGQPQEQTGNPALMGQYPTEMTHVQGAEPLAEFAGQVDVSDVIRQITEFARISVRNAATTMEMQLNPENLGKVYLEITSKAGTVSAHITTQNEIVKEALEAQITTLKENMNQAGVKVDAVEVTVENHEFEKNLEQNAKQEERRAEEQEAAAKRTRSINLNDLDELNGILSEEESLVAQMMAEQGNSVDFTA